MAKLNKGDLIVAEPREIVVSDYNDVDFGAFGKTEIEPQDLKTPRIVILNGMSDGVAEGLGRPGEFFNMGTKRVLGRAIQFVPLGYFSGRVYIDKRDLLCKSIDRVNGDPGGVTADGEVTTVCAQCVHSKWGIGKVPPKCDITYTYPVLAVGEGGGNMAVAYLSFRGTANDAAKQLNGDHEADGQPWFFYSYQAEPQQKQNERGTWFVMKIRRVGPTEPELRAFAYDKAKQLAASRPNETIDIRDLASSEIPA